MICKKCESEDFVKNGLAASGKQRFICKNCGTQKHIAIDSDVLDQNVNLAKKNQKLTDKRRIENRSFRDLARIENSVEEYTKEIAAYIKTIKFPKAKKIKIQNTKREMIIQLSDLHLNELVRILGNEYDFRIASKRLYKYAYRILSYIKSQRLNKVNVVFTGDLLNSDRRTDELLSNATNRAKATLLAVKLLSQFISFLSTVVNVDIVSVSGNESRIRDEYTHIDELASDNFDFMIYEIMKLLFVSDKRVNFVSGDNIEYILDINGVNILAIHGDRLGKMTNADLSKTIAKWAKKGIIVNYILCGHLHEAMITDTMARSSSLVGGNDYSDRGLNLYSRASQNIHFVYEDGSIDSIKVDLQNVKKNDPMFEIDEDLIAYNAKSLGKLNTGRVVIFKH